MKQAKTGLQYQPLNVTKYETRFLRLLKRRNDDVLSYSLETGSLIDPPPYIALSYQWYPDVDPTKRDIIIVDGIQVPVTTSLSDALWYTTWSESSCRLVWADQICIDQCNIEERSQQVQQMGKIYASAYMVHAWLGGDSHDSDHAMDACLRAYVLSRRRPKETVQLSCQEKDAIAELVRRPYFERVWIIQELAKADWRRILCGNRACPWTGLEMALKQMWDHLPASSQVLMEALMSFRRRERLGRLAVPRMLLMQALLDSRRSLATEPRDKIYALLGMTRDGGEAVPAPHYNGCDAHIYTDVARHFITKQGHTAAILLAPRTEGRAGLPSWVPNWSRWYANIPPWIVSAVEADRESLGVFSRYEGDRKHVSVPGLRLETIKGCVHASSVGDLRAYGVGLSVAELRCFAMKIAWNKDGRARVVHRNAKSGDFVYRLENCILPVVLRGIGDETFKYVGEVYVDVKTDGYWSDFNGDENPARETQSQGKKAVTIY